MFEAITNKHQNLSLALGFFDGVHLGHREVILNAVNIAKSNNTQSAVITFNQHPAEIFGQNIKYISTLKTRNELIYSLGVDYIFSLDFNKKLAEINCDEYLANLVKYFKPIAITTGFNHTFGKAKCGTPKFLYDNQEKYGFKYYEIPQVLIKNKIVSSSEIRQYLSSGDIITANKMLADEFSFSGTVIKGQQLGRKLGYPTTNVIYPEELIKIPYGVYCVDIIINEKKYSGMMNFGVKPTIDAGNKKPIAETHIFNFNSDIYDENIKIIIKKMIRKEQRFQTLEDLKIQIEKDIQSC